LDINDETNTLLKSSGTNHPLIKCIFHEYVDLKLHHYKRLKTSKLASILCEKTIIDTINLNCTLKTHWMWGCDVCRAILCVEVKWKILKLMLGKKSWICLSVSF